MVTFPIDFGITTGVSSVVEPTIFVIVSNVKTLFDTMILLSFR